MTRSHEPLIEPCAPVPETGGGVPFKDSEGDLAGTGS